MGALLLIWCRLHPPRMVQSRKVPFLLISCDAKIIELNLHKIVVLIPTLINKPKIAKPGETHLSPEGEYGKIGRGPGNV